VLSQKLLNKSAVPQLSPMASSEALDRMESDIRRAPRGVAYVVHLLLPHFGYMYTGDCLLANPADWDTLFPLDGELINTPAQRAARYRLYLNQLVCTESRLAALFEELKQLGVYDSATIIVHGDHGSRLAERPFRFLPAEALSDRDVVDHFSTLLAVKMPGLQPGLYEAPVALQSFFAEHVLGRHASPDLGEVFVRIGEAHDFARRKMAWPPVDGAEQRKVPSAAR
jgi:hypothetical protein